MGKKQTLKIKKGEIKVKNPYAREVSKRKAGAMKDKREKQQTILEDWDEELLEKEEKNEQNQNE